ncbi:hypothetical protein POTOM_056099 [Populus tomentosa]|uniref:PGG domain-containing protein n=1 Tax=Populus tomentosa TaxID=118781 RepID=A0A8X7Y2C9_POPTO|nr:hypothetical protein POTOM_056099 [Populus tomentosa]
MEHSTDIIQSSSTLQLSMQKEVYTYAKEDNFNALFGLLSNKLEHVSSEEVLNIIFKHVAASGNSLLHVAASHGSEGVIQLLCYHFPLLITRKNFLGDNALHLAARARRFVTIQNLVNHVKIDPHKTLELASLLRMKNNKGNTPLRDAASMGIHDGARLLVSRCPVAASQRNEEGNLPIHVACQKGHLQVVRELLNYWLDPMDFLNEKGHNILHVAAGSGQMRIVDEILRNRDLEALINEKDYDGNTPLHEDDAARGVWNKSQDVEVRKMRKVLKVLVEAADKTEFDNNLIFDSPRTTLTTEERNRGVGNLLVVSVLVAEVTFAGAITVPGSGCDLNSGSSKKLMRYYIYLDMLAMDVSLIAAIILCRVS